MIIGSTEINDHFPLLSAMLNIGITDDFLPFLFLFAVLPL